MLASVLFPEPLSPTSPTFSPVRRVTVIPSRMTWGPKDLWRSVAVRTGTARSLAEESPGAGPSTHRSAGSRNADDVPERGHRVHDRVWPRGAQLFDRPEAPANR